MSEYLITYLEPTADERNFANWEVKRISVKGLVTFVRSFCVVFDKNKDSKKYYSATRILQIDERLSEIEQIEIIKKYKEAKKSVIYYHKTDIDSETGHVKQVRCIAANDKPFGFECFLAEIEEHFTKCIIPSFKQVVYIPNQKIIGIDEKESVKQW